MHFAIPKHHVITREGVRYCKWGLFAKVPNPHEDLVMMGYWECTGEFDKGSCGLKPWYDDSRIPVGCERFKRCE